MISIITTDYPEIKKHLLDANGKVPSFINIFVDDDDIRNLQQEQTAVKRKYNRLALCQLLLVEFLHDIIRLSADNFLTDELATVERVCRSTKITFLQFQDYDNSC